MCGIVGWLGTEVPGPTVRAAMRDALLHRGPDDGGEWCDRDAGVFLGHRRLSILDLSAAGAQPMHSQCGRYVLVFNGEIYNFAVIADELRRRGLTFQGHADTEVLVEALSHWGIEETLRRVNGMFAFAAWDRRRRRLLLARDRIGEKPLYYGWCGDAFLFASELAALHAWPGFKPRLDRAALALYLRHDYVPDPFCVYAGLRKLVPGSWLELTAGERGSLPAPRHYWSLAETIATARETPADEDDGDAVSRVEHALRASIGLRMVADVPLGAFLSGGIDSSLVVALMQAQSPQPVRTFSIGFDSAGFDEAPWARAVAAHLGTAHTELYVTSDEARAVIPGLAGIYDEPFADASQIPSCLVARLARREVKVALSGDAGDELFAGYTRYTVAHDLWRRARRKPACVRRGTAFALRALSPAAWDRLFELGGPLLPARLRQPQAGDKLHKLARMLDHADAFETYLALISMWPEPGRLQPGVVEPAGIREHLASLPPGLDFVEQMMALDTLQYLPGDILAKIDRASMAVGLETRVPFLDPEVIACAWRLPRACKVRDGHGKWVLRELLARHVPRPLFERPKMGFGVPLAAWLRGPLREWAAHLLEPQRLAAAGIFAPAPVAAAWSAHLGGEHNLEHALWGILMFEAWRERWPNLELA